MQAAGAAVPALAPAAGGARQQVRGRGAARDRLPRARQGLGEHREGARGWSGALGS